MADEDTHILHLPDDTLLHVLSFLDYKDLTRCCLTCHRLQSLTKDDFLWKRHCRKYWCENNRSSESPWHESFKTWYEDFGRYIHIYRKVRKAWDQIENVTRERFRPVYESLQDGKSEEELDAIERLIGAPLPNDLRCAYRIHNGQSIARDDIGLFGYNTATASLAQNNISEYLMPLSPELYSQKDGPMFGCLKLTAFFHGNSGLSFYMYIAMSEEGGFTPGNMLAADRDCSRDQDDSFVVAKSFVDWFTKYAQRLSEDAFPVIDGKLYREFYSAPDCLAVTQDIKVTVATAFLPLFSSISRPYFFHTYRITLSMSPDAPPDASCKLETRHWTITNENGQEESVAGPGVVGEYPVMRPGATFSWISFTNFSSTYGNMSGYFTMRNLQTGRVVEVKCPTFHMKCHPYETRRERNEGLLKKKKDQ